LFDALDKSGAGTVDIGSSSTSASHSTTQAM
jgi:hypothetical protein